MKYTVTFEKYYTYEVEANDYDEAFDNAYEEFKSDMRYLVADMSYDNVEVCKDELF